jgi:precorrin-6A/cobalt-precorrin-6A reductase
MRRVLVLGGTTEASALAARLAERDDVDVVTSLAGRTAAPAEPAGRLRVGGFGGADGLARYLADERVDALVDATHPFAARMRWHAREAAEREGVPCLRVERPPWQPVAGDDWRAVRDLDAAAAELTRAGFDRVFLTTGRQELAPFSACRDTWFLIRAIDAPAPVPLSRFEVVLARGPFTLDGELTLLRDHRIDAVVTKNSGGSATEAKLLAARQLGLPVVIVERPPSPSGPQVDTVDAALEWLAPVLSDRD